MTDNLLSITQSSEGNESPNSVKLTLDSMRHRSTEVSTIMQVIFYLSSLPENPTELERSKDATTIRDPENKINKRFSEYSEKIKQEWITCSPQYEANVVLAREHLGLSDDHSDKVSRYLRFWSVRYLEDNTGDPLKALDELTKMIQIALEEGDRANGDIPPKYDFLAIRFYLLHELIKCNVFPNPKEL